MSGTRNLIIIRERRVNIFAVDEDPELAAEALADTHVVKMVLESGQILSTVHHRYGTNTPEMYKPTHPKHPCVLWAGETKSNYYWLRRHFTALAVEYTYRYGKSHLTWEKLGKVMLLAPNLMPDGDRTPFALAMPNQYKLLDDPVECYRAYYKFGKAHLHRYSYRPAPAWLEADGQIA